MTVLVVDDSRTILVWVRSMLTPLGHVVHTAASGKEALVILDREPIQLVMTDLVMPEMDGAELLSRVRERADRLPVVIMSGVGSIEDAVELLRVGADEFLPKPIRQDELLACLGRVAAKASVYEEARLFSTIVQEARRRPPIERLGELLTHFARVHESPARAFSLEALDVLMRFDGPDAQFEALVEKAVRTSTGLVIERSELDSIEEAGGEGPLPQPPINLDATEDAGKGKTIPAFEPAMRVVLERFEKLYAVRLLGLATSRAHALELSGLDERALEDLVARHGLQEPWHTPPPPEQVVPTSGDDLLAPP